MLTDERLTDALRDTFCTASEGISPSAGFARTVRRQARTQHRRTRVIQATAPLLVVGVAVTGVCTWAGHPDAPGQAGAQPTRTSAAPATGGTVLTLDGYQVSLRQPYTVLSDGKQHNLVATRTNPGCTADSTPSASCPRLRVTLSRTLPSDARPRHLSGQPPIVYYVTTAPIVTYLQATVSPGSSIYLGFTGRLSTARVRELADGLSVRKVARPIDSHAGGGN